MPALALAVVGIALPDSLNPTLIVAAIYLTLRPRPVRQTLAFTLSAFVVTLAGGLVVAFGLGDLIVSLLPKLSRTVKYEVMTIVGVALIAGGAVLWFRRDSVVGDKAPSRGEASDGGTSDDGVSEGGTSDGETGAGGTSDGETGAGGTSESGKGRGGSAVLMGAGIAGVEFLTAFPYFAAIAMVVGASVPLGAKAFLIVLYNVIYVSPLIAIVIVCMVMGDQATRVLTPIGDWISINWPIIVAPLAVAVGVAVTAYAITQLV
jgi:hypothetical protein